MIRCQTCQVSKPDAAFPYRRRGEPERRSICRACTAESYRAWAAKNRASLLERKRAYWHQAGKQLREAKKNERDV